MPTINLLPWRSQMRAQRRKYYLLTCDFAMVSLIIGLVIWRLCLSACEQNLAQSQAELSRAHTAISKQLEEVKSAIVQQQQIGLVIAKQQSCQQRLLLAARLLQRLGGAFPNGAILKQFELNGQELVIKVVIATDDIVPILLAELKRVPEIRQLRLQQMQRQKNSAFYELALLAHWQQQGENHVENQH